MARYCTKCGNEVTGNFCEKCGTPLNTLTQTGESQVPNNQMNPTQAMNPPPMNQMNPLPVKRKKKGVGCLIPIIVLVFVVVIFGIVPNSGNDDEKSSVKVITDVNQFSEISVKELEEIMGKTEDIESLELTPASQTIKAKIYTYKKGKFQFVVADKKVVRMNINSSKYYKDDGKSFTYTNESDFFEMFGMKDSSDIVIADKTSGAVRYQLVSDKVDEYWIPDLDEENKTFDTAKVTFDQMYFGDLVLTSSEENDYQYKCQKAIEGLLKAPSTAKFPNILKWYFGKNIDGVVVQAYVDSQNSFGAQVRSKFQFIIKDGTVTSLIFDGEEYIK